MVANFIDSTPQIDTAESIKHLELLGYRRGDKPRIRYIGETTIKADGLDFHEMRSHQSQGRNTYVVVNPGGHDDQSITAGRAIFYEHDNLDKNIQLNLWQTLGLPEPTFQVDTGGKSIHSYWVFENPLDVGLWRSLQSDLLEFSGGDKSIKNPSRVMRLAGSLYIKHGEVTGVARIVNQSGITYRADYLRRIIPSTLPQELPRIPPITPSSSDVPLYRCLTIDDRALIDSGTGEGDRNDKGAKLARNLIGTAARLQYLGHRFEGDPRQLFEDYCNRCSPPLDAKEADLIWRSAEKDNPTATLTDDAIENCVKSWQKNQGVLERSHNIPTPQSTSNKNVVVHPAAYRNKIGGKELRDKILELISQELTPDELVLALGDLSEESGKKVEYLFKLYRLTEEQQQQQQDKEQTQKIQIPKLFTAKKSRLNPFDLLFGDGGELATMLYELAETMPTSVEHLLTTLVPVVGSLIGTSSEIVAKAQGNFVEPCIFQSLVLARSGELKSPTQKVIVKPLERLENLAREQYQEDLKEYAREYAEWQKNKDDSEPPTKPTLNRFIVSNLSQEAKIKLHCENPRGLLQFKDEASAFWSGRNKYRNGIGDDQELELSEFNGGILRRDLVDPEKSAYIPKSAICKTGNTQFDTLKGILAKQDFNDHQGDFARWLISLVPSPTKPIDLLETDDGLSARLQQSLESLYEDCLKLPERQYFLSIDAKKHCNIVLNQIKDLEGESDDVGMSVIGPKLRSYFLRLILWIHLVNSVLAGNTNPTQMIDQHSAVCAGNAIKFYLDQHLLLRALFTPEQKLEGDYLKIKDYLDRRKTAKTVRDIKYGVRSLRSVPSKEITAMCDQMVQLGALNSKDSFYFSSDFSDDDVFPKNDDILFRNDDTFNENDDTFSENDDTFGKNDDKSLNTINTHQIQTQQALQQLDKNKNDDNDDTMMTGIEPIQIQTQQALQQLDKNKNDDNLVQRTTTPPGVSEQCANYTPGFSEQSPDTSDSSREISSSSVNSQAAENVAQQTVEGDDIVSSLSSSEKSQTAENVAQQTVEGGQSETQDVIISEKNVIISEKNVIISEKDVIISEKDVITASSSTITTEPTAPASSDELDHDELQPGDRVICLPDGKTEKLATIKEVRFGSFSLDVDGYRKPLLLENRYIARRA
ncbi:DUF3987 domain-containing protein [Nodularia sp. UHCC 0506]|uniref:DUF3987 domain-containing protein n=1 Tax=Nodularia sp. UHCC 0506 TaxID=3110243 RepID=UPI002B2034EE|nr:DUF3987 domain-containing protein [Nodularia sp. UHCC 0506]MEA5515775.1 DUF3987 domain-containing protein [Nodularia sp. UHCC 0506]